MRRFLLIAMVMFALPVFAQNYTMRLAGIYSEDGVQSWDYIYPSETNSNVVCINELDFLDEFGGEITDSIYYDDNNNIVRISTWQKFEGEWVYACYVEYEYDENNLKISRKNYNNFGGFQLGGIFRYYYDEEGKMTNWTLSFSNVEEYQKGIREYDEDGFITSEVMQQYNFQTYYIENATMVTYEYDEDHNVVRSNDYYWEAEQWGMEAYRAMEYDEYGNCLKSEQRTPEGTVQERKVFEYDLSVSADSVFYYPNPEDDFPQLPKVKNLLKSFEYYAQNDNMELSLVTTYSMNYEVCNSATAVGEEYTFASSVYPNPAQDFVMVESSEANYVEVVDVYGRVMFSSEMSETVKVDMSEFASGIYFVKLQANGATSVQKIMKK